MFDAPGNLIAFDLFGLTPNSPAGAAPFDDFLQ